MRGSLNFFLAAILLIFAMGCDEDNTEPLKVVGSSIKEGDTVPDNTIITVTFNNEMASVEINVSSVVGNTVVQGKIATWTPATEIPIGTHRLTVTGTDIFGQELGTFGPIIFFAGDPG